MIKIKKGGVSVNATSTLIPESPFNKVVESASHYQGKDYNGLNFQDGDKVLARLTEGAFSRVILDDEGGKPLNQVLTFPANAREAGLIIKAQAGVIYSVDITEKQRADNRTNPLDWRTKQLSEGKPFYEAHLKGVPATAFELVTA